MSIVDRFTASAPYILGVTRILAGVMFACHGAQKMLNAFGGIPPQYMDTTTRVAGTIELVGGILIAIGLFTRPAAFLSSGLMAFAYFMGHGNGEKGFFPIENGGETAILYCWFFLYLAARGPGAIALDNLRTRRSVARA